MARFPHSLNSDSSVAQLATLGCTRSHTRSCQMSVGGGGSCAPQPTLSVLGFIPDRRGCLSSQLLGGSGHRRSRTCSYVGHDCSHRAIIVVCAQRTSFSHKQMFFFFSLWQINIIYNCFMFPSDLKSQHCLSPFLHILHSGTSPHAPGNIHVLPSMTSANVSWEPGYDGGFEQTFSVWYGPV